MPTNRVLLIAPEHATAPLRAALVGAGLTVLDIEALRDCQTGQAEPPDAVLVVTGGDAEQAARTAVEVGREVPVVVLAPADWRDLATSLTRLDLDRAQPRGTSSLVEMLAKAMERARKLREDVERLSRLEVVLEAGGQCWWEWDVARGLAQFSRGWVRLIGHTEGEIAPAVDEWFSRVHPDDLPGLMNELHAHLSGQRQRFRNDHRLRRRDGDFIWVEAQALAIRDGDGAAVRLVGSVADVTERKRSDRQLLHDAFHDALTGLPNRALFLDHLRLTLERSRGRRRSSFAVLFLDLDHFKTLNDTHGHQAGDRVLVELASRLLRAVRPGDVVARLGGDEFGVLLPDVASADDAVSVTERVLAALREPLAIPGGEVLCAASIGVAFDADRYDRAEDVLRDADVAMYRAKASGRGCYALFDEDMHERVASLAQMERDLRTAVDDNRFVMHYQPIVDLADGRVVALEGLVRWLDGERGLVPPERFLAVAEESGLIVPIGWWALRETCHQVRRWQQQHPATPALVGCCNVSAKLLKQRDLVERLAAILEETEMPPASLRLEITEALLVENPQLALRILSQLRTLGVLLSVDDFGTGFSSLGFLHRFSCQTLKIDRSFTASLETSDHVRVLVRGIITLAAMLGVGVVAEGVETVGQASLLRSMGCPQAQGFLFSRPLSAEAASAFLARSAGDSFHMG